MDYTLAQYYSAFDLLAFEGAREKLVKNLGYPAEVAQFEYDPNHFARGLVIDKQRGNIIKVTAYICSVCSAKCVYDCDAHTVDYITGGSVTHSVR
jgi:5' nucleotidase family